MPLFSVTDAGAIGIIRDVPGYELPPNAWTNGANVRMRDGSVHKVNGDVEFWTAPQVDPYYITPVQTPTSYYWVYAGLQRILAQRGVYHYDITRASGNYTMAATDRWNSTNLGGVRVFNNGVDVPQFWAFPTSHLTPLADLTNWPSIDRCSVMRAYKNYLVATSITRSGVVYPNLVKWSHGADIGAVPSSWDITNAALDAGEYPLPYGGGIVDQLGMRDFNVIYCDEATWGMQYIGGSAIFRFWPMYQTLGLLAPSCAAEFFGSHFVVTPDDVVVHDGQQTQSVATKQIRRALFNSTIGESYYYTMFVLHNRADKEMWVCYPLAGTAYDLFAYVWSYGDNTWSIRSLPLLTSAAFGVVNESLGPNGLGTWNSWSQGSWASASGSWDVSSTTSTGRGYDGRLLGLVGTAPSVSKLYQVDSEPTGLTVSYIEREGLVLGDPSRKQRIQVNTVYPRIEGTTGGVVRVTAGFQNTIGGTVLPASGTIKDFRIGVDYKVDFKGVEGRFIYLKFDSDSAIEWHLKGYDIDYDIAGTK